MDSNSAEVHAIHRACQLISSNPSLSHHKITIISDSKSAVSWINGADFGNFLLLNMVYDIRQVLHSIPGLVIIFMPRGSNSLADGLAKAGSSRSGDRLVWGVF